MMIKKVFILLLSILTFHFSDAQIQISNGPLVKEDFNTTYFKEEFDSISPDWPTVSNFNNLFMIQNGSYYMSRKVKGDPYAVISSKKLNIDNFSLTMKFNPVLFSAEGYFGVLFMLQESSIGGYIFEIGPESKFRLRQVKDGLYKNITGNLNNNGWIFDAELIKYNQNNTITISSSNRNYDLSINSKLVLSFNDIEYKNGSFGVLIGPESKVSIDNINITTKEDKSIIENISPVIPAENPTEIAKLKELIDKLQNDNDELLNVVETMKAKGYSSPDDFEAKYVSSVATYNSLKLKYDSLVTEYLLVKNENDSLKKKNTVVMKSADANLDEIMIELDELKIKNQELEKENAVLSRRVRKLTTPSKKK